MECATILFFVFFFFQLKDHSWFWKAWEKTRDWWWVWKASLPLWDDVLCLFCLLAALMFGITLLWKRSIKPLRDEFHMNVCTWHRWMIARQFAAMLRRLLRSIISCCLTQLWGRSTSRTLFQLWVNCEKVLVTMTWVTLPLFFLNMCCVNWGASLGSTRGKV